MLSTTSITTALVVLLFTTTNTVVVAYVNNGQTTGSSNPTKGYGLPMKEVVRPQQTQQTQQHTSPSRLPTNKVTAGTGAWRVALNIGNAWPIVFKCDFDESNKVLPQQTNIRYTVRTGEVVKPISSGEWSTDKSNRKLAFSVNFPEDMSRNHIKLNSGPITCEGLLYTQEELQILNDNFYRARDKTWEVGGQLNDMSKKRDAPKQWNEVKQVWEKQKNHDSFWSFVTKMAQRVQLHTLERQEQAKRPDPKTISEQSGYFPGFDGDHQQVFMGKMGTIKQGLRVIGTWAAEPINDQPVSYSGN